MGEGVSTIGGGSRQRGSERLRQTTSGFSSCGSTFDSAKGAEARRMARQALDDARTPRLYGTTEIDFGSQGKASVRRTGTERKGSLQITLNGENVGSVDYNENGRGIFSTTAEDAFKEVKRRIGYRIKV